MMMTYRPYPTTGLQRSERNILEVLQSGPLCCELELVRPWRPGDPHSYQFSKEGGKRYRTGIIYKDQYVPRPVTDSVNLGKPNSHGLDLHFRM